MLFFIKKHNDSMPFALARYALCSLLYAIWEACTHSRPKSPARPSTQEAVEAS